MAIIGPDMTDADYATGKISSLDVFEGRIKSWILAFARTLAAQEDSGIAILSLTSSVFEPMGGALTGGGNNSESKFCAGFVRAIQDVPGGEATEVAKRVRDLLRDGLFHEGFIKAGLVLEYGEVPIQIRSGAIVIDPRRFLDSVEVAFAGVCEEIRAGDRKNFNAYWDRKLRDQGKSIARFHPEIGSVATSTGTAAVMPPDFYIKQM